MTSNYSIVIRDWLKIWFAEACWVWLDWCTNNCLADRNIPRVPRWLLSQTLSIKTSLFVKRPWHAVQEHDPNSEWASSLAHEYRLDYPNSCPVPFWQIAKSNPGRRAHRSVADRASAWWLASSAKPILSRYTSTSAGKGQFNSWLFIHASLSTFLTANA